MSSQNLRKVAAETIVTNSSLSRSSKLQLLNFIENEATEYQVMAYLLDGTIVQLDEQAESIVEDRFNCSEVSQIVTEMEPITAAATLTGTLLAKRAGEFVKRRYIDAEARACKGKSGKERTQCIEKLHNKKIDDHIAALRKAKAQCAKTKNPEKCAKKIDKEIAYQQKVKAQKLWHRSETRPRRM